MNKHSSELRWGDVKGVVSGQANRIKEALIQGEESYRELVELYQYAGGTAQLLANQLFEEDIAFRQETEANASEVQIAQDAIDAMTAIHDLYEAATNQTVAAEDRLAKLRRVS